MGYRSDVMAVFYTYDPTQYPAIKLFIDENIPEFFRGDKYMSKFEKANLHGLKFTMSDVKWYPSYPDVSEFERATKGFNAVCESGVGWNWEFVRLGEEIEDVEEKGSPNHENLLYVVRDIECDF
jgi:hypothetical protein